MKCCEVLETSERLATSDDESLGLGETTLTVWMRTFFSTLGKFRESREFRRCCQVNAEGAPLEAKAAPAAGPSPVTRA